MPFLDTALKVVRLLSALVWLAVSVVTLWGTWVTFQQLRPFLRGLAETGQRLNQPGSTPGVLMNLPVPGVQDFLRQVPGSGGR